MEIIAAVLGPAMAALIVLALKNERRVTRLEGKVDSLLKNNGIDPKEKTK